MVGVMVVPGARGSTTPGRPVVVGVAGHLLYLFVVLAVVWLAMELLVLDLGIQARLPTHANRESLDTALRAERAGAAGGYRALLALSCYAVLMGILGASVRRGRWLAPVALLVASGLGLLCCAGYTTVGYQRLAPTRWPPGPVGRLGPVDLEYGEFGPWPESGYPGWFRPAMVVIAGTAVLALMAASMLCTTAPAQRFFRQQRPARVPRPEPAELPGRAALPISGGSRGTAPGSVPGQDEWARPLRRAWPATSERPPD
jgi:hypothetical protein